jgi:hypothetical protein
MLRGQLVDLVRCQSHNLGVHSLLVHGGCLCWRLLLHGGRLRVWLRHVCLRLRCGRLRWVCRVVDGRSGDGRGLLHGRRLRSGRSGSRLDKRAEYLRVNELQEKERLEDGIGKLRCLSQ